MYVFRYYDEFVQKIQDSNAYHGLGEHDKPEPMDMIERHAQLVYYYELQNCYYDPVSSNENSIVKRSIIHLRFIQRLLGHKENPHDYEFCMAAAIVRETMKNDAGVRGLCHWLANYMDNGLMSARTEETLFKLMQRKHITVTRSCKDTFPNDDFMFRKAQKQKINKKWYNKK